jgi:hypothetical protein
MVISEGDGHVGGVHSTEVVLTQVVGRESLGVIWAPSEVIDVVSYV